MMGTVSSESTTKESNEAMYTACGPTTSYKHPTPMAKKIIHEPTKMMSLAFGSSTGTCPSKRDSMRLFVLLSLTLVNTPK